MDNADEFTHLRQPQGLVSGITYLYVLFKVCEEKRETWCVRIGKRTKRQRHRRILYKTEREFARRGFPITCVGGGYITFDFDKRQITLSGKSSSLGTELDRNITISVVRKVFIGYSIEVKK